MAASLENMNFDITEHEIISPETMEKYKKLIAACKIEMNKLIHSELTTNNTITAKLSTSEIKDFAETLASQVVNIPSSKEAIKSASSKSGDEYTTYCENSLKRILEREFNSIKSKLSPITEVDFAKIIKNLEEIINNFKLVGVEIEKLHEEMGDSVVEDVFTNMIFGDEVPQKESRPERKM